MKNIKWLLFIFVIIINTNDGLANESVRIAIEEWEPYVSEQLEHYGVAAHIVTAAFARENINVEYGFFPWKRVQKYVEDGKWDASILWVWTEERAKIFNFTDVAIEGKAVFFHLKSYPVNWSTFNDLKNMDIGGLLSATYPWFKQAEKQGIHLNMYKVINEKQNFSKILGGRINIFSLDKLVGYNILHSSFKSDEIQKITNHPRLIETWKYRLIFSKKIKQSQQMVRLFNKGLKNLKNKKLIKQYLADAEKGKYLK